MLTIPLPSTSWRHREHSLGLLEYGCVRSHSDFSRRKRAAEVAL
jgi:hypothetical protein